MKVAVLCEACPVFVGTRGKLGPNWELRAPVHQIEGGPPGVVGGGIRALGGQNRCRRAALRDTGTGGAGRLIVRGRSNTGKMGENARQNVSACKKTYGV